MNESIIIGSDRGTAKSPWPGVSLVLVLALAAVVSWELYGRQAPAVPVPVLPIATTTTPVVPATGKVSLVFLDNAAEDAGTKNYGCDGIVTVEVAVPPTVAPITAAMNALFDEATTTDLVPGNFVAEQDLTFDRAVVEGKVARVYLKGTPTYAGVCDDPRVTVQIRETVLANAPAVETVEIFVNGEKYEVPSEKGE